MLYDMFYDKSWHFMGSGRGGRRFGRFSGEFRGFGRGIPFRSGRKLSSSDLQLLILALLAERPSHGYELMKTLEERSRGFYSPSPGVIYPALTYLEELGYVTVEPEGPRRLYHIAEMGRAHLEQHRIAVDAIFAELERIGRHMDEVRRVLAGGPSDTDAEDDGFGPTESADLHAARRALKAALFQMKGCSREEVQRIADILRRAALEIRRN
jgi:DNA-binding PadR family transcriptional regulator